MSTVLKGLDVSKYQVFKSDYYETLDDQKLSFVFIKASEGIYPDPMFATHSNAFAKTSLLKGAYHFLRFQTPAEDQAKAFLQAVNKVGYSPFDLPPVLDIEDPKEQKTVQEAKATVKKWLDIVEGELGIQPIIYTGGWYWRDPVHMEDTKDFKDYRLWTSQYTKTYLPMYGGWAKPTFWQYTEHGGLQGYVGFVDLDYFFDDIEALWGLTKNKKLTIKANTVEPKIFAVQTALLHMGFYSGLIDGRCEGKTLAALNEWSARNNLPAVSDTITPQHWKVLFNADITSAPAVKPAIAATNTSNKPSGTVIPDTLNIRSGPAADKSKVALALTKGQKVNIISESDGWLNVTTEIEGWVSKPFIQQ